MDSSWDVTELLLQVSAGDRGALDAIVPLLYDELRAIAHDRLRDERPEHTLNTTGLVHEAYLRLVDIDRVRWQDRAHFLAMASSVMRRILVDYARRRGAAKRGGGWKRVQIEEADLGDEQAQTIEDLDEALSRLQKVSQRQSRLLEMRFFGGLKLKECAHVLGVSVSTLERELRLARAWLARELSAG